MNARALAQDAASYYLSTLDPHESHATNVQNHLRGPVLAITRRILAGVSTKSTMGAATAAPPATSTATMTATAALTVGVVRGHANPESVKLTGEEKSGDSSLNVVKETEMKTNGGSNGGVSNGKDWRDYLHSAVSSSQHESLTSEEIARAALDYDGDGSGGTRPSRLRRRTKARMEAFLAGCALALPDDPLPPTSGTGRRSGSGSGSGAAISPESTKVTADANKLRSRTPALAPTEEENEAKDDESKNASVAPLEPLSLSAALSGFSVSNGHDLTLGNDEKNTKGNDKSQESLNAPPSRTSDPSRMSNPLSKSNSSSFLRRLSSSSSSVASSTKDRGKKKRRYPQFHQNDLALRIELYARSLRRVVEENEDCVVSLEPSRAVRARVKCIVRAFVSTVGCVRSISPVLTNLILCMTKELLAVDVVGDEIRNAIARLVSEYEHLTSFASLAFLSSPEESAESHLMPLLTSYVQYLQSDWKRLVEGCEIERLVSMAIDADVRRLFKTIEFRSIGHLLDVCHEHRVHLQNMYLPPASGRGACGGERDDDADVTMQCSDPRALKQALRDLEREIITVNGRILPPARSIKELARLLAETLNSRTLTLVHRGGGESVGSRRSNKGRRRDVSASSVSSKGTVRRSASFTSISTLHVKDGGAAGVSDNDLLSSGNEADTDGSEDSTLGSSSRFSRRGDVDDEDDLVDGEAPPMTRRVRKRSFDIGAIDFMTRRLLIAASRTGAGGDAYFIVRDLFGGEEVEVLPSRSQPTYCTSRPSMMGKMPRKGTGGTIELIVRLASVTIKCHGRYDVYPKPLLEECEPLIQLHTTTTETISLQEVRADDGSLGVSVSDSISDKGNVEATVLVLREKMTDTTGQRTLSIRPARYEKVEVWNTPS